MLEEIRLTGAFAVALLTAYGLTPVMIAVAWRTGMHDHPVDYKAHARPTPYLGGAAVLGAFALAAVLFGGGGGEYWPIVAGAAALAAVGTVDDRVNLSPGARVLAEMVAATVLWGLDLGWTLFDADLLNLVFTNLWIVGLVNAFNLMDNMDGASTSVATACGFGIGLYALFKGETVLAGLAFAVAGACSGFIPFNLAAPARIFLGDGGSMPVGFVIAACTIQLPVGAGSASSAMVALLLVGLPVFDTALVMVSRRRRGVSLLTGGLDHLTHRLRTRLPDARAVALRLAAVQAGLCGLALVADRIGDEGIAVAVVSVVVVATVTAAVLETSNFEPAGPEAAPEEP